MIVRCSYCDRQRVDGQWIASLSVPQRVPVSHGICSECYAMTMRGLGFSEAEIAVDLSEIKQSQDEGFRPQTVDAWRRHSAWPRGELR